MHASCVVFTPRPRKAETRAQVEGNNAQIANNGVMGNIVARLPRPLLFALRHHVALQVQSSADGTKITNTGTPLSGLIAVAIPARPLRLSTSEALDEDSLSRRSIRLMEPISR